MLLVWSDPQMMHHLAENLAWHQRASEALTERVMSRHSCSVIVWNDVVLFAIHKLKLNRYTRDALNKPVWKELTYIART